MFEVEFRPVAGLAALKFCYADRGGPDDRLFPEAKVEKPRTFQPIVQTDKFIDRAGADAKTEHEGYQFSGLLVP